MCYNSTNYTLYNCDGNLSLRAILIFTFTGISTLISLIFLIFFCVSKPVWLDFELKNNVDNDDDDNLEMSVNTEEENLL
jgi:hypothetical protein